MSDRRCDPCAGPPGLPDAVWNRPGLSAVGYRIGTFATFRTAALAQIRGASVLIGGREARPLVAWDARDPADFGAALIDLWAYLADVLTFYQERTANEAFLRTAVFADSVHRLVAALGYRPAPGAAARADLAFALEPGKRLTLPPGVRVQSVPGPDEKPQKFETAARLVAAAALNRFPVRPVPVALPPLTPGGTSAPLDPAQPAPAGLAPGNVLVLYDAPGGKVEEKRVTRVAPQDGRQIIQWDPPTGAVTPASARLSRFGAKFGLFGATAAAQYPVFRLVPGSATERRWALSDPDPNLHRILAATTQLDLDGPATVTPGRRVLVAGTVFGGSAKLVRPAKVTAVDLANATVGGQTGRVTRITLDAALGQNLDRQTAVVYLLDDPDPPLSSVVYGPDIAAGADVVAARVADAADLKPGRVLVLGDGAAVPHRAVVRSVSGAVPEVQVAFNPPLPAKLTAATAFALGNVAAATHGETVPDEVLGDGDPTAPFQAFTLAKWPVTHLPAPGAPGGVASTLRLRVNGVEWSEVRSFFGRRPDERVFVADRDDAGKTTVRGGDGSTGAAFEAGAGNVVARYRVGLGAAGNVAAETLRTPLVRPIGVRGVTNPLPAAGGADPEPPDRVRANAPGTVRTFGRVVSLRDFADAAREFPGVAKASAAWDRARDATGATAVPPWADPRGVRLVVLGAGGVQLAESVRAAVKADLDARRDPFLRLTVAAHRNVPLRVTVAVLTRAEYDPDAVEPAVRAALLGLFAFDGLELGKAVHLSDVLAVAQKVAGVLAVDVDAFGFKDPAVAAQRGYPPGPVPRHARLFPDELPGLDPSDLTITRGAAP